MERSLILLIFHLVVLASSEHARAVNDLGMPDSSRMKRSSNEAEDESPVKIGLASGALLNGVTRIASNLPQFNQDGRHFWPSVFSMSRQIGLEGVNGLVDDVSNYERTRALAVAREAACAQQMQCWLSQNFAGIRTLFGAPAEEQKLLRGLDCDKVFAGCQQYH